MKSIENGTILLSIEVPLTEWYNIYRNRFRNYNSFWTSCNKHDLDENWPRYYILKFKITPEVYKSLVYFILSTTATKSKYVCHFGNYNRMITPWNEGNFTFSRYLFFIKIDLQLLFKFYYFLKKNENKCSIFRVMSNTKQTEQTCIYSFFE